MARQSQSVKVIEVPDENESLISRKMMSEASRFHCFSILHIVFPSHKTLLSFHRSKLTHNTVLLLLNCGVVTTCTCFTPELWAGTCFKVCFVGLDSFWVLLPQTACTSYTWEWWENRVCFVVQILFIALDNTEPERKAWHAGDAWWYFNKGNKGTAASLKGHQS